MINVKIGNYGNYSSSNYGSHSQYIDIGTATFYFSYQTVIAFSTPKTGLIVRKNSWKATTGKHLNWIDGGNKKSRINSEEFENKLNEVLKEYNLFL